MNVIELLSRLVEFNTVNNPGKGIKPSEDCAKFIRDTLSSFGVDANIMEVNGFYTVHGVIGDGEPVIGLMAHYDTVPFIEEEWNYNPLKLTIVNGKGYGRGAVDDKANVASIMIALKEITKLIKRGTIVYAFTGDEEIGGANGAAVWAKMLERRNLMPKYLINGDGINMNIIIRRRNVFRVTIKVKTYTKVVRGIKKVKKFTLQTPISNTGHAAYFIPGVDHHPLIAASQFLRHDLRLYALDLKGSFIKSNVLPKYVELTYIEPSENGEEFVVDEGLRELLRAIIPISRMIFRTERYSDLGITITPNIYEKHGNSHVVVFDIRAMISDTKDLEESLKYVLNYTLPQAEFKVSYGGGYLYTDPSSKLVQTSLKVLEALGESPRTIEAAGASDSRFFSSKDIEIIDIGPKGGNVHGPNEYVELDSLKKMPLFYTKVIEKILE